MHQSKVLSVGKVLSVTAAKLRGAKTVAVPGMMWLLHTARLLLNHFTRRPLLIRRLGRSMATGWARPGITLWLDLRREAILPWIASYCGGPDVGINSPNDYIFESTPWEVRLAKNQPYSSVTHIGSDGEKRHGNGSLELFSCPIEHTAATWALEHIWPYLQ